MTASRVVTTTAVGTSTESIHGRASNFAAACSADPNTHGSHDATRSDSCAGTTAVATGRAADPRRQLMPITGAALNAHSTGVNG